MELEDLQKDIKTAEYQIVEAIQKLNDKYKGFEFGIHKEDYKMLGKSDISTIQIECKIPTKGN